MYKIVICLCLLIPAIANADDYNLLKLMQTALDGAFEVCTNLLKTEVDLARNDVDSVLSTFPRDDPFLIDVESPSEDGLIEITLPVASGTDRQKVERYLEPANECARFLTKHFGTKKEDVQECSKSQLDVAESSKKNLLKTFNATLETFELLKTRSIPCDRNSTTIVENMMDALCVRKIELEVRSAAHEAGQLFLRVVRDVRKIRKTWMWNLLDCLTQNEKPSAVPEYLQACKFQLEIDYPSKKTR